MRAPFVVIATAFTMLSAGCSQSLSPTSPSSVSAPTVMSMTVNEPSVVSAVSTAKTVPFKGNLEGLGVITFDPPPSPFFAVHLEASGNATHLGRFTVDIPHRVDTRTGTAIGTFAFTAANGDRVTGNFTGVSTPTAILDVFSIEETATITGGTGRFADATGSFIVNRLVNLTTGLTTGSFEGTISSPGNGRP